MFNRRGAGNYAYTSARVKAKKANLLKEEDYNKMLMMTVPEISHYISEAGYSKEMAELGSRYSGLSLLEYATYANMSKAFRSILASATGELSNMVYAYLTKWDFANLKVILRGKNYGSSVEDIKEDLVPAGLLKMEDLEKMIAASNMEDVLALFKSKTNLSVSENAISVFKQDGVLTALEDELTKDYYRHLLAAINGNDRPASIFRTYVKHVIDSKNIEVVLKMKVENLSGETIAPFFIPGGSEVDERVFNQVANAADFNAALTELQQLRIYADINELLVSEPTVVDIVGAIENYKIKLANEVASMYPLSVIPVVNYMIHKEIEVRNIRMLAHGVDSGLDRETMKSLLVI